MSPRIPDDKNENQRENRSTGTAFRAGLWMDEMVDKMMEKSPTGYVGFQSTYKDHIRKLSSKT